MVFWRASHSKAIVFADMAIEAQVYDLLRQSLSLS